MTTPTIRLPAAKLRGRGQALVEFAFVLPALLLMTLGVVDLGRAFVFGVAVQDGTREAARLAERSATDSTVTDASVLTRLMAASNPALFSCSAPTGTQAPSTQTCGGGSWAFSIAIQTPNGTTYTSIDTARADTNYPGSQLTVTARGTGISLLSGFQNGWGQRLSPITVQGQAAMVVL